MRVLVTAFEPYGEWPVNASHLCLQQLVQAMQDEPLPSTLEVVLRTYPVEFSGIRQRLWGDLQEGIDVALLMGQSPGAASVQLESIALNVGHEPKAYHQAPLVLEPAGPVAYRSELPLCDWADRLRTLGIPARVSYHAGTYLCNASLYYALHYAALHNSKLQATFLHLPFDLSQTLTTSKDTPSLPSAISAHTVHYLLKRLAG